METKVHHRFLEILPGLLTWTTLILPVILSLFFPVGVAIFLLFFTTFWLYQSLEFSVMILRTYFQYKQALLFPWSDALRLLTAHSNQNGNLDQPAIAKKNMKSLLEKHAQIIALGQAKDPFAIFHLVVIATCGEDLSVLRQSIQKIADSHYDLSRIVILLAGEERDRERAIRNAEALKLEFGSQFAQFYFTLHPADTVGEVRGKGANIAYAARTTVPGFLKEFGCDPSDVLVTTLDADHCVHPEYFACLTTTYLTTPDRGKKAYQPLPLFYNNIWDVPLINRMIAFQNSFWHMIESGRPYRLRNFASHAQSLDALLQTDFWSSQTIVEDGHQYWRSFFTFNGQYEVIPLFIPIYQDAVQGETYTKTLWGQYKQLRRWAWGASDIPFVIQKIREKGKAIPAFTKYINFYRLVEGHFMWATAPVIITLTQPIPRLINESFANTVFSYNMGIILSHFFTVALVGIFASVWITILMAPPIPHRTLLGKTWLRLSILVQWLFLPLITIVFGAIPAIESQTRLMFAKYLDFQITPKVRVPSNIHAVQGNLPR